MAPRQVNRVGNNGLSRAAFLTARTKWPGRTLPVGLLSTVNIPNTYASIQITVPEFQGCFLPTRRCENNPRVVSVRLVPNETEQQAEVEALAEA